MISIFILIVSLFAQAKFDLSYGTQGRSLPSFGAEFYADAGYNQLLWGKKKSSKDILYGLVRPSIAPSTSFVINAVKAELEVFPISPIGISVGRQIINSTFDFPFFKCEEVTCKGTYERNFVEGKMVLGFKGWIALSHYKVDTITSPRDDRPMADWRNVIIGNPGREVQIEKKLLLGKLFANKMAGILMEKVQFQGSKEYKESFAAVYQVRNKDTSYMAGAGPFHTSQQGLGVIFYLRIHYLHTPSLKLF
jgi:hypothetical protein